jgi:hypothetical protein
MKEEEKIFYNDYLCFYCRHKFNARSGRMIMIDKKLKLVKNGITCPKCKAMLPNKGGE